jgi:hypothetical protein
MEAPVMRRARGGLNAAGKRAKVSSYPNVVELSDRAARVAICDRERARLRATAERGGRAEESRP